MNCTHEYSLIDVIEFSGTRAVSISVLCAVDEYHRRRQCSQLLLLLLLHVWNLGSVRLEFDDK